MLKVDENPPVAGFITAAWVIPFTVIETLPGGTSAPALIVPDRVVDAVARTIVGELTLLKMGVAAPMTIDPGAALLPR